MAIVNKYKSEMLTCLLVTLAIALYVRSIEDSTFECSTKFDELHIQISHIVCGNVCGNVHSF